MLNQGVYILQLAILGLLLDKPMHGYELNKKLTSLLGTFKALSYGSLYPNLKKLKNAGYIVENENELTSTRKAKKVYQITPLGEERFAELSNMTSSKDLTDDQFSIQYAFFEETEPKSRIRILENRRRKLEIKRENLQLSIEKNTVFNKYISKLNYFKLNTVEQEIVWINEQITEEIQKFKLDKNVLNKSKEK